MSKVGGKYRESRLLLSGLTLPMVARMLTINIRILECGGFGGHWNPLGSLEEHPEQTQVRKA